MDYYTDQLEDEFKKLSWDEVYSFIEFTINELNSYQKNDLSNKLNKVFYEEGAQYKITDGKVSSLLSEVEADEITSAQNAWNTASVHITKAIEFFSKRPTPDYSNTIKESISAVEAIARKITGNESATLSDAVKNLDLPSTLSQGITKIYAWTSDEGGIRHSLKSLQVEHGEAEARFALVFCSALVNFFNEKLLASGKDIP